MLGWQTPALWHWLLAVQVTGLAPVQVPAWQVSACGAGVAVAAAGAVRLGRVRASARGRIAGPDVVALVRRRADDRRPGGAGTGPADLSAVAGVAVAARDAVQRRVGASPVGGAGVGGAGVHVIAAAARTGGADGAHAGAGARAARRRSADEARSLGNVRAAGGGAAGVDGASVVVVAVQRRPAAQTPARQTSAPLHMLAVGAGRTLVARGVRAAARPDSGRRWCRGCCRCS